MVHLGSSFNVDPELFDQVEQFVCHLYGSPHITKVNELGYELFCLKAAGVHNFLRHKMRSGSTQCLQIIPGSSVASVLAAKTSNAVTEWTWVESEQQHNRCPLDGPTAGTNRGAGDGLMWMQDWLHHCLLLMQQGQSAMHRYL